MRSQTSCHFYPRPPRGGRPCTILIRDRAEWISIHALREEGDARCCRARSFLAGFLSTPSARRATCTSGRSYPDSAISIHALREEGDNCSSLAAAMTGRISIHALREEGDPVGVAAVRQQIISIHALREEGDFKGRVSAPRDFLFLSTPSARRATVLRRGGVLGARISIHALREEGDHGFGSLTHLCWKFLSTPSARRATMILPMTESRLWLFLSTPSARRATKQPVFSNNRRIISIHALREEGDFFASTLFPEGVVFLSTPSARRATVCYIGCFTGT